MMGLSKAAAMLVAKVKPSKRLAWDERLATTHRELLYELADECITGRLTVPWISLRAVFLESTGADVTDSSWSEFIRRYRSRSSAKQKRK
jgi:hypothetical protein